MERAVLVVAMAGGGGAACTLLTSTSDLTGGLPPTDAAAGSDRGGDVEDHADAGGGDATTTRDGDAALTLPTGAVVWSGNGHGYLLVNPSTNVTWVQAKVAAEDVGGHLVTITSQAEEDFVVGLVVRGEPDDFRTVDAGLAVGPFFGAYQPSPSANLEPAGGWAWVTGEVWSYTAWHAGQPNNSFGNENYGSFGDPSMPGWNDVEGTSVSTAYVVEFE